MEPNRALAKAGFSRQRRQNGAGERHRATMTNARDRNDRNDNPVRVDSRFVGTNSFWEMLLSSIWV